MSLPIKFKDNQPELLVPKDKIDNMLDDLCDIFDNKSTNGLSYVQQLKLLMAQYATQKNTDMENPVVLSEVINVKVDDGLHLQDKRKEAQVFFVKDVVYDKEVAVKKIILNHWNVPECEDVKVNDVGNCEESDDDFIINDDGNVIKDNNDDECDDIKVFNDGTKYGNFHIVYDRWGNSTPDLYHLNGCRKSRVLDLILGGSETYSSKEIPIKTIAFSTNSVSLINSQPLFSHRRYDLKMRWKKKENLSLSLLTKSFQNKSVVETGCFVCACNGDSILLTDDYELPTLKLFHRIYGYNYDFGDAGFFTTKDTTIFVVEVSHWKGCLKKNILRSVDSEDSLIESELTMIGIVARRLWRNNLKLMCHESIILERSPFEPGPMVWGVKVRCQHFGIFNMLLYCIDYKSQLIVKLTECDKGHFIPVTFTSDFPINVDKIMRYRFNCDHYTYKTIIENRSFYTIVVAYGLDALRLSPVPFSRYQDLQKRLCNGLLMDRVCNEIEKLSSLNCLTVYQKLDFRTYCAMLFRNGYGHLDDTIYVCIFGYLWEECAEYLLRTGLITCGKKWMQVDTVSLSGCGLDIVSKREWFRVCSSIFNVHMLDCNTKIELIDKNGGFNQCYIVDQAIRNNRNFGNKSRIFSTWNKPCLLNIPVEIQD